MGWVPPTSPSRTASWNCLQVVGTSRRAERKTSQDASDQQDDMTCLVGDSYEPEFGGMVGFIDQGASFAWCFFCLCTKHPKGTTTLPKKNKKLPHLFLCLAVNQHHLRGVLFGRKSSVFSVEERSKEKLGLAGWWFQPI